MVAFQAVMHGLLDTRNATRAGSAGGAFQTHADYRAARIRVDEALKALAIAVAQHDDPLNLKGDVEKLTSAFAATESSKNGLDDRGRTVFGPVTAAAVELLQKLGDQSNLVVDPDLDSFYLVNALVLTMPQALEDLGQLWGWGTYAIQKGSLSSDVDRRYYVWDAGVSTGLKNAREHFSRAIKYNSKLKSELDLSGIDQALAYRQKVKSVEELVASRLTTERVYAEGKQAVSAAMGVYQSGLQALDRLLIQRQIKLERVLWASLASVLFAIGLAIYLFFAFYRVMHQGLFAVAGHLSELAQGDLRRRPHKSWARDETALLIDSLSQTYESLHGLIQRVRLDSSTLHVASHEIAAASSDLSERTAATASALEQQANTMGEIGAVVGNTANTAREAAEFSGRNAHVADQAGETISRLVATMNGIHASSARVNDIVGVIDGIAFQTNILALNAAVEAARAGHAGRGFAVVATEVRHLAQRSAGAAKEIRALIFGSVERIDEGTRVVEAAGKIMGDVVTNARHVNQLLAQIASSSEVQSTSVEQAGRTIQELDRSTQQNAALVEETSAAAAALKLQADKLQGEIQRFHIS